MCLLALFLALLGLSACSAGEPPAASSPPAQPSAPEEEPVSPPAALKITVGEVEFLADWADNSSARAFQDLLAQGPLTLEMSDYGGFEKVAQLDAELPRSDAPITAQSGDVILYQGDHITLYYGTNAWTFTRLASIGDPAGLQDALGPGAATVTFSLA